MRNPLVWLSRFRHRRGYGVHSPFAFDLITQVLYSPGEYYAYSTLDQQFSFWERALHSRRLAVNHLLFRLANRWQPRQIWAPQAGERELSYLHQGCLRSQFIDGEKCSAADLLYLSSPCNQALDCLDEGSMLVLDYLTNNKKYWRSVRNDKRTRVTFDLYDVGIAFFDSRLQRQDFVINW